MSGICGLCEHVFVGTCVQIPYWPLARRTNTPILSAILEVKIYTKELTPKMVEMWDAHRACQRCVPQCARGQYHLHQNSNPQNREWQKPTPKCAICRLWNPWRSNHVHSFISSDLRLKCLYFFFYDLTQSYHHISAGGFETGLVGKNSDSDS